MKLEQKDREKLYKAKGKAVKVEWPLSAPKPRNGHRYVVHNEDGEKLFSVRVEASQRLRYGTKATVRIDEDPFRPMIGIGGVRLEDGSYETEPERVPASYEKILCNENLYKSGLLRNDGRRSEDVRRLEGKLDEAKRLNKPGRVRILETRISRKIGPPDVAQF